VVAKLDRLGRDQRSVINRLHDLQDRGIHIRTLDNLVNTKAMVKFAPVLIGLLTGLAEVERSLIRKGTLESVQHRRGTGVIFADRGGVGQRTGAVPTKPAPAWPHQPPYDGLSVSPAYVDELSRLSKRNRTAWPVSSCSGSPREF
jgi:hypothetical protein